MSEYGGLALVVIVVAVGLDLLLKTHILRSQVFYKLLLVMSVITLVATQFLDGLPIVKYNDANTTGLRLGYMPIEDLSYTLAACIIVPSLWKKFNDKS